MTTRFWLLLVTLTLPLEARAGACVYFAEGAGGKAQTTCTYRQDEAACEAEAAKEGSASWLKTHPPKFVPAKTCNDAVAELMAPKRSKQAKKKAAAASKS